MKLLIIRTDFGEKIGAGHVMRCLALAQEWIAQNRGKVFFVSKGQDRLIEKKIQLMGCQFLKLKNVECEPGEFQLISSIIYKFKKAHPSNQIDPWVVIDGYHFNSKYQSVLKSFDCRVLVIDDMAHLDYYYADIILNQNINASEYIYRHESDARLLIGNKYTLIRNEFFEAADNFNKIITKKAKNILVTMGGSDIGNMTTKVCRALSHIEDGEYNIKVLIGPLNNKINVLKKQILSMNSTSEIVSTIAGIPNLMTWADIAISAGGSTCWETAYLGLPTLVVMVAENQKRAMFKLDQAGIIRNLGWHTEINDDQIANEVNMLIQNQQLRKKLSEGGRMLVDGKGRQRVVGCMLHHGK